MAKSKSPTNTTHTRAISNHIVMLRGQRIILDTTLASLYGVATKRLNEQVKRNQARFPNDFMFRLTVEEAFALRSQIATSIVGSKTVRGGSRYLPYAFTEHGAIQAANVLNSPQAIEMSVHVVRAFVQLRELLASNQELAKRLDDLESRIKKKITSHDEAISAILSAIRELMATPPSRARKIGFTADIDDV